MAISRTLASSEAAYVSGTFWLTVGLVILTLVLLVIAYWTATLTRGRRINPSYKEPVQELWDQQASRAI